MIEYYQLHIKLIGHGDQAGNTRYVFARDLIVRASAAVTSLRSNGTPLLATSAPERSFLYLRRIKLSTPEYAGSSDKPYNFFLVLPDQCKRPLLMT